MNSTSHPATNAVPSSVPSLPEPVEERRAIFTDEEKVYLKQYLNEYKARDRQGRKELLGNTVLVPFLDKFYPGISGSDRKLKKINVGNFFANNARSASALFKVWNRKLRFRDVVLSCMRDDFNEWLDTTGQSLHKDGIGPMQLLLTEFIETVMTVEQKKMVQKLQEQYEEDVYPLDLQIKNYEKCSYKANQSVDRSFYQKMGQIRLVLIASHKTPDVMRVELVDNAKNILPFQCLSMAEKFPEETTAFWKAWKLYANYIRQCELHAAGSLPTAMPPVLQQSRKSKPVPHVELEYTHLGTPLMPPNVPNETGGAARKYIRAYIAQQYSQSPLILTDGSALTHKSPDLASGIDAPPYSKISENMPHFLTQGSYPPGFILKDPSNMTAAAALAFCNYIRTRQTECDETEVFRFLRVCSGRLSTDTMDATYREPGSEPLEAPIRRTTVGKRKAAQGKGKRVVKRAKTVPPDEPTQSGESSSTIPELFSAPSGVPFSVPLSEEIVQATLSPSGGSTLPEPLYLDSRLPAGNDDYWEPPSHRHIVTPSAFEPTPQSRFTSTDRNMTSFASDYLGANQAGYVNAFELASISQAPDQGFGKPEMICPPLSSEALSGQHSYSESLGFSASQSPPSLTMETSPPKLVVPPFKPNLYRRPPGIQPQQRTAPLTETQQLYHRNYLKLYSTTVNEHNVPTSDQPINDFNLQHHNYDQGDSSLSPKRTSSSYETVMERAQSAIDLLTFASATSTIAGSTAHPISIATPSSSTGISNPTNPGATTSSSVAISSSECPPAAANTSMPEGIPPSNSQIMGFTTSVSAETTTSNLMGVYTTRSTEIPTSTSADTPTTSDSHGIFVSTSTSSGTFPMLPDGAFTSNSAGASASDSAETSVSPITLLTDATSSNATLPLFPLRGKVPFEAPMTQNSMLCDPNVEPTSQDILDKQDGNGDQINVPKRTRKPKILPPRHTSKRQVHTSYLLHEY